ncbi:MAG: hypothetical protein JWN78_2236 [Bacteroidota bacterium]|nr:hypothetical protein [Bacteroidota bacterium]
MIKELINIFGRDLDKLREEISLYKNENDLWIVKDGINNSAGNLCLHLIGNLSHFIGATLGNSGYIRNRDLEFSSKNIPREEMIRSIEKTILIVESTLSKISPEDLQKNFPLEKHGGIVTIEYMLLHLMTHLSYHLGQINYHRRLVNV